MFKVQSSGCGQLCYCSSGPLNFQSFYYKTCTIARFFCFCPLKRNYPADCLQQRTQPIGRESSVTVSADCIQFLCPLNDFFQKSDQPSFSWGCSDSTASTLSGSQEGSVLLCSHCDDPKQCSSFLCLAAPPGISLQAHQRLHSHGSGHVTSHFLQQSPHLFIKLLSLLALPKEIFCKTQVFILGSNVCRSPFAQAFFFVELAFLTVKY